MKAYYGFQVKGTIANFLEQFKDFQWTDDVNKTGFLGVEITSTEYVAQKLDFPRLLNNYLVVSTLSDNKSLTEQLLSYQKEDKKPVIFVPLELEHKYFENWNDYESFLQSQNKNTKKIKP